MAHGQITHIEFPADDVARARRFYEGLLGWEFGEMPGFSDYFMVNLGASEAATAAVGKRDEGAPHQLRLYVEVDSIDTLLPKVAGLGGKIVEPKAEVPGQGWFAVIDDSEGNQVGLFEGLPS